MEAYLVEQANSALEMPPSSSGLVPSSFPHYQSSISPLCLVPIRFSHSDGTSEGTHHCFPLETCNHPEGFVNRNRIALLET